MVKYTFLQKKKKEICYLHLGKYLTRLFRHEDHRHEFNKEVKFRFLLLYTRNVKISDIVVFIFSWTAVVKNCSRRVGKRHYFLFLYNLISFISL